MSLRRRLLAALALCASGCLAERASTVELQAAAAAVGGTDTTLGETLSGDLGVGDQALADADQAEAATDDVAADNQAVDGGEIDDGAPNGDGQGDAEEDTEVVELDAPDASAAEVGDAQPAADAGDAQDVADALDVPDAVDVADAKPPSCTGKNCDDGNLCTVDSCSAGSCVHVKAAPGSSCDDGNACTNGDKCLSAGTCVGGTKDCDDGVGCTFDGCDPLSGCSHAAKNGQCDDGVACTVNSCDTKAGCVFTASDAACDDGLACTTGEKCDAKLGCSAVQALFNQTYGGGGNDDATAVVALSDGGFAVAGYANSENLPGGQKAVSTDYWLVRTDKVGTLLWSKTYGGTGEDSACAVASLADGGYALAGTSASLSLPGGQKSAGYTDFWLVRTDNAGSLLWSKTYGGLNAETARAMVVLGDGGFALAGQVISGGGGDFWLVRTDKAGVLQWSKAYDEANGPNETAQAVALMPDGGFALAGPGGANYLLRLVRTDQNGVALWSKTYSGQSHNASGIAPLSDGGLAVLFGNFSLMRTDKNGVHLWSKDYGGFIAYGLAALPDGGFALAGFTLSEQPPGGAKKNAGDSDAWLVRTDSAGTLLWSQTYGGSNTDRALGMALLADGGFALAGRTNSNDLPGKQKTAGNDDFWLIRTDAWGHADCAEAGSCFSKVTKDCDDANACTADQCEAKAGCTHANLADGTVCGTNKVCAAGVCK